MCIYSIYYYYCVPYCLCIAQAAPLCFVSPTADHEEMDEEEHVQYYKRSLITI